MPPPMMEPPVDDTDHTPPKRATVSDAAAPADAPADTADGESAPQPRPRSRWRTYLWTICQAALSIGLLAWLLSDPGILKDMGRTAARADWFWLLAGVICGALWIAAATVRWSYFLRVQGVSMKLPRLGAIYLIAMFFSLVLPGAVGMDAVRVGYLIYERRHQKLAILFSIMTDHMAGMIAVLTTAAAVVLLRADWLSRFPVIAGATQGLVVVMTLALVGIVIATIASRTRFVYTVPRFVPFRQKLIDTGLAFGMFAERWRLSLCGLAASFVTIFTYFATFYCAARAFDARVPLIDIFSLMPIIDVISGLPVAISGIGVREKLFESTLETIASVPSNVAILISLSGFGFTAIWSLTGALVFILYRRRARARGPQRLRDIVREAGA